MSWTMVTESKPDDSYDVIICRETGTSLGNYIPILDRWICLTTYGWEIAEDVRAWMQLPAPPEEAHEGK